MKALILYYSYGGNTHKIATHIQQKLRCDMSEISTIVPYPSDYDMVVEQGQREITSGFEPRIQPLPKNINEYDVIYLGTPVWWYTFAPAIKTALASIDLSGKTILPFATNGGWVGHTFQDIETLCYDANIKEGLDIKFDGNKLITSMKTIDTWLDSNQQIISKK